MSLFYSRAKRLFTQSVPTLTRDWGNQSKVIIFLQRRNWGLREEASILESRVSIIVKINFTHKNEFFTSNSYT